MADYINLDLLARYDADLKAYIAELLSTKADDSDLPVLQHWTA